MKETIITTAKKIWVALGRKGEVALSQLPLLVKETPEIVYQALGWLAREDKVQYRASKRATYVSLIRQEAEIFNGLMMEGSAALEV